MPHNIVILTVLPSPAVPYPLVLKVAGDHSLFLVILVFFLFTHWYYIYYYRIVSFVVGVFPCHSLLSAVTLFGLMEVEMEMQLSSYHGCWGYSIAMVHCVGDFLYCTFLHMGRYQLAWRWISCLIVISHGLSYFQCIFHSRKP